MEGLEVLANADPGEKLAYFGQDFNLKALDANNILEVLTLDDQLEGQMGFGFQKGSELQPLFSYYIIKVCVEARVGVFDHLRRRPVPSEFSFRTKLKRGTNLRPSS